MAVLHSPWRRFRTTHLSTALRRPLALPAAALGSLVRPRGLAAQTEQEAPIGGGGPLPHGPAPGRPVVRLKEGLTRQLQLDVGHPWIYDDEVENISNLTVHAAGTVVDILKPSGSALGVGVLNRQASIVVRRLEGLDVGADVTEEMLRTRLREAFAARGDQAYCRAANGEQDGLPGMAIDRFGSAAVVVFESVGSARLQSLVQEELTRWMGQLDTLAIHRMVAKKEKWAQRGAEFETDLACGDSSTFLVSEEQESCTFEFDAHHGMAGHWNYSLEVLRQALVRLVGHKGTVLDAWSQVGQWGVRCAKAGATEVVLLDDSLSFTKTCKANVIRNGVDLQCTVLHRGNVVDELRTMATSGIRFSCVSLNIRLRFQRYFKQRRGQFGRWFMPSLKGYSTAVYLGAQITSRGGYLLVSFLLPIAAEHWALSELRHGLERAGRPASLVFHVSGLSEHGGLASSAMDDAWLPLVACVRLS